MRSRPGSATRSWCPPSRPTCAAIGTPAAGTARNMPERERELESALDDLDHGRAPPFDHDRRDVEAKLTTAELRLRQPQGGQPADALTLLSADRFDRRAEAVARPGLHLAEHERPAAAQDEIELTGPTTPVAVEDLVARRLVPLCGQGLTALPEGTAVIRRRRLARRRSHRSLPSSPSMLTSLNVTTRTLATKRAGRYMSHTQASESSSSKYTRPCSLRTSIFTPLVR